MGFYHKLGSYSNLYDSNRFHFHQTLTRLANGRVASDDT